MSQFAYVVVGLALIGAFASWIVGAVYYARTLRALAGSAQRGLMLRAIFAWPFAVGRLQGDAAEHASKVNKALVAFFACLIIAASAVSVATNLARVSR
jgi:hypothetical protein